jgi:hypothetical protein
VPLRATRGRRPATSWSFFQSVTLCTRTLPSAAAVARSGSGEGVRDTHRCEEEEAGWVACCWKRQQGSRLIPTPHPSLQPRGRNAPHQATSAPTTAAASTHTHTVRALEGQGRDGGLVSRVELCHWLAVEVIDPQRAVAPRQRHHAHHLVHRLIGLGMLVLPGT